MGKSKDLATGETRFVNTAGDTMTGALTVGGAVTVNPDADSSLLIKDGGTNALFMTSATGDELYIGANNEYAIRIKSDGTKDVAFDNGSRVTIPSQPMFHAWCTDGTNGSVSGNSSPTSFYVSLNVGSHFSSGTFTAPIDGKYRFYYSILTGVANGGYGLIQFTVNNSGAMGGSISSNWGQVYNYANANDKCITRELLINLSANDYVKLQVNGSNTNFYWDGGYSYFGGHLIG